MNLKTLFITVFLITLSNAFTQSSVYKVTGKGTTMYLGGTIHILKDSDFPLPKEYDEAYLKSSLVIFETNMDEVSQQELGAIMMELARYEDGKSLKTELTKTTYNKLNQAFEDAGMSLAMFENMKPMVAIITLTVMKLQKLGYNSSGVDDFFQKKAENDDVSIGTLEKLAYQMQLIAEVGDEDPNAFVEYSLKDMDNMKIFFEDMKSAWRKGDGDALVKMNNGMFDEFPEIYEKLLVTRNNNWMKKINNLMKTSETEFILVGALHLFGEKGLIKMMEAEGYKIEQL